MALPAIAWTAIIDMTVLAKAHIQWFNLVRYCHVLNIAVTESTNLFHVLHREIPVKDKSLQVLLMSEVHKVRQVMYFFPGWWLFVFPVFGQPLDAWLIRCNDLVATHAFTGWGDACHLAATRIGVAVHAIDLVDLDVDVMRKLNGLNHIFAIIGSFGGNHFVGGLCSGTEDSQPKHQQTCALQHRNTYCQPCNHQSVKIRRTPSRINLTCKRHHHPLNRSFKRHNNLKRKKLYTRSY